MDGRAGKITREVVRSLSEHDRYARVLTRNPILALQDADVFRQADEYATIGSSIPTFNAEYVSAIEPRASAPQHRIDGLKKFNEMGVNTFVSMSPTYPTLVFDVLRSQLQEIRECDPDVVFPEPMNPRSGNFRMTVQAARDAGETHLADSLDRLRDQDIWLDYCLRQFTWVQLLGEKLGQPVRLWPDKRQIKMTEGEVEEWLSAWKERQSPEEFADRDTHDTPMPKIPGILLKKFT